MLVLNNLINSDKRNTILNSIYKGQILKEKTKHSEHGFSFFIILQFLIRLHNFVEKHDNILKCALRLEFIRKNFTMLKQAFQELGW